MGYAIGHYINIYGKKDVFVMLNEPNDPPTMDQNEEAITAIRLYINDVYSKKKLEGKLEEIFPYGVQIVERKK